MAAEGVRIVEMSLANLTFQELSQLKLQLDQELKELKGSIYTLSLARSKFEESGFSLEKITPDSKGKDILLPLTGSLYVPGKVAESEKVIIDIGTGYYITKDIAGAKEYFKKKVDFVDQKIAEFQLLSVNKGKLLYDVMKRIQDQVRAQVPAQMQAQMQAPEKKIA